MSGDFIKRVKGVKDITPGEAPIWRLVEDTALDVFELYGYHEIRTPIFERTEVFSRSIGETTDIVEKEMYTFTDRGGESLTLRPEGTAPVVRAYIENRLYDPPGVRKLFYFGPMFRAERPQAGRFRQFHQFGAEVFGSADPGVDAEVILALMDIFGALGVTGLKVSLNSLGCPNCRPAYRKALHEFLKERVDSLCGNCRARVDRNPFRALDCKAKGCQDVVADAPTIDKYRCDECEDSLDKVRRPLLELEVPVTLDPRMARGLDYYTRTAFEVTSGRLGAQNAVAGGGRYDLLVEQVGGPPTPAVGFAVGMERLISLLDGEEDVEEYVLRPDVYIIDMTPEAASRAFELAHRLRARGYVVEKCFEGGSLKSRMRKAGRSGARFTMMIGEDEIERGAVTLKDMESGEQKSVPFGEIADALENGAG